MKLAERISGWIKEQVEKAGAKGCMVGLSGGLDSSTVAVLCKQVFPNHTLGLIMPCHSSAVDLQHARALADKFSIETKLVDLTETFNSLYKNLEGESYLKSKMSLCIANLKPRLRMLTLYYFANNLNYLVVGTGDKSEIFMGYFTKYGDGGVDLLPIGNLLKTQVKSLAKELGIPKEIIEKAPTAGLWEGQTDEGEMGITYEELDKIIQAIESKNTQGCEPKTLEKLKNRNLKIEHKLKMPPLFDPKKC